MEYKGYVIEGDGTFGMKVIKSTREVGRLPNVLVGLYSSAQDAKRQIDLYLFHKQEVESKPASIKKVKLTPREVANGTESESGD